MIYRLLAILIGFILDLLLGDPQWKYHPIRLIGSLIASLERILRRGFAKQKTAEIIAGVIEVLVVTIISTVLPLGILILAYWIHPIVGMILESIGCYFVLALKSLRDESMKVYQCLEQDGQEPNNLELDDQEPNNLELDNKELDNLEEARKAVSMIVGRDTQNLTKEGITKATVETVAENVSDGVIAPLFYLYLGGAALGFLYKSVNTLDSMIGYKNEKYLYFGRFSAKLDDIFNYIPARLAGILMVGAAGLSGMNMKQSFRIFLRDRKKHASPNSAHTEAACAGALQIELAGDAYYFGTLYQKDTIGNPIVEITKQAIKEVNRLSYVTGVLGVFIFSLIYLLLTRLVNIGS